MYDLTIGTVVWRIMGERQDGKITWYAVPKCIEKIEESRYVFDRGGCSKNSIGKNYFLTRQEALDDHVARYGSLVEDINPNDPLEKMLHSELKDRVTEYPRTYWNDLKIIREDSVNGAAVYLGSVTELQNITDRLCWKKEECSEYGYFAEYLTLREIYEQVKEWYPAKRPIITVFQEDPLSGTIYQCGNYEDGRWVNHGTTKGYA